MDKQKEIALNEAYDKLMAISTNQIPVDGLEELVDPEIMGYGTTVDEEVHDLEGYIQLIKAQEEQARAAGLHFNFDRTLVHKRISAEGDIAVFVENIIATVQSDQIENQFTFRFSAVMEFKQGSWKLIHWHGSIPGDTENDTWHVEEWQREKERLEKLVAEQTTDLLQKNKELEIEAASERMRAVAMGMQKPDDIMLVISTLRKCLADLQVDSLAVVILIDNEDGTMTQWDITEIEKGELKLFQIHMDLKLVPTIAGYYENAEKQSFVIYEITGEKLNKLAQELQIIDKQNGQIFQQAIKDGVISKFFPVVKKFSHGFLEIDFNKKPPQEIETIATKMGNAFEQSYIRFLDLQKAEQQTYESKVEASLERVRGIAAAMNHSDDLRQIAEAMFKEMEMLKINPLRYGLGMINGETKEAEIWASNVDDGSYLDMLGTLSLTWHPMLQKVLDAWEAQHQEVIYELKGKELSDYYQKVGPINPNIPNLEELQDPDTDIEQFVSFFPFKSGALYAFTNGEPGEDGKSILKRFANVFEQAHIRYDDLQIAEKQARLIREERDRLEIALKELEATQDQLVQQEKLASLGQLTAGIAHEIKNPLNFVNNFSELSVELIDEAREEIKEINSKFNIQNLELSDLLDDIETNLRKIHEHGTRADSIVKSMLEHSRGGSGKMEPTDLNGLVKEFVNLSFHGMRAGKNPINVDMEFDLDDSIGDVPLIAEDFSRVIINLCNNAFDAMREKLNSNDQAPNSKDYKPKLTVRTYKKNQATFIEIEDNGPGISPDIKEKILQPFFTTKKGTEGTGLGLSITNDIIKAHGGFLEVSTNQHEGTCLTIKLSPGG
ncbi:ATP-binding protein [Gracilimonas sp.]|uniref:ATP-binding protein n=1 Tax=Gracilimonas sp. TaxID=1974203 RepID=UPI003D0A1840